MLLIQNTCVVIGVKNFPNLKSEKRKSMKQCLGLNQNYPNPNPNPNPKGLGFNPNLISILTLTLTLTLIPRG